MNLKNQVSAPWRVQPAARRVCGPVISISEMVLGPAVSLVIERGQAGLVHRGDADLLAPAVDVLKIAADIAGEMGYRPVRPWRHPPRPC